MPTDITSTADLNNVFAKSRKIIVGFYAPSSEPCKAIVPAFEGLETDFGDVVFLKVNVDQMPELYREAADTAGDATDNPQANVPAFVTYLNGKDVGMVHGTNLDNVRELLEGLSSAPDDDDD